MVMWGTDQGWAMLLAKGNIKVVATQQCGPLVLM